MNEWIKRIFWDLVQSIAYMVEIFVYIIICIKKSCSVKVYFVYLNFPIET